MEPSCHWYHFPGFQGRGMGKFQEQNSGRRQEYPCRVKLVVEIFGSIKYEVEGVVNANIVNQEANDGLHGDEHVFDLGIM